MSHNSRIRVLIADADSTLREALAFYFSLRHDMEIVGQATNDIEARFLCRQLNPDILLIDPTLKEASVGAFVRTLCQENPDTKIIVLSSHFSDGTEQAVLEAGAAKYLEKGGFASDLAGIIFQVSKEDEKRTGT
jgi:DNA-binding NarL/FixJ family response regulator